MSLAGDATLRKVTAVTSVRLGRGTCTALVGLSLLLVLMLSGPALLGDPDTQWHVAVGRWIVAHHAVPTTDVFSYTFAGAPWIAKEWLSQLILFGAVVVGGWSAVVALTALVLAGSFASLFAWLSRRIRLLPAMMLTLAAFALCEPHMLARPHTLVVPIILAWSIVLVDALERGAAPRLPAILLMIAWANMHGSFPLGLVMAAVLAGEALLQAPAATRPRIAAGWALFIGLSAAATMASPFGWRAVLVPLKMFGNGETLRFVAEWRPLELDFTGIIAMAMLVATTAVLLLDARRNLFRLLLAGLIAYLMLRHARFVSLFGLLSPVLAARSMGLRLPPEDGPWVAPAMRGGLATIAVVLGLASAGIAILGNPVPAANMTPQKAYDAALAQGVRGRVYNDYDFGGFLIAHGVATYIDGRTDQLFLGSFLPDVDGAIEAKDDAALTALLDKAGATWALVRARSKTTGHLDRLPGWTRLYADDVAAVYRRDGATGRLAGDPTLP